MRVSAEWNGQKKDYTEVAFSTRGGYQVGFYLSDGKLGYFMRSGAITSAFMKEGGLSSLRTQVGAAQAYLASN